jgi:hypothetical protein
MLLDRGVGDVTPQPARYSSDVTPTKQRTRPDGLDEVASWRRETLIRAGYPAELAEDIALSGVDLRVAEEMLRKGCTPELAAQILL